MSSPATVPSSTVTSPWLASVVDTLLEEIFGVQPSQSHSTDADGDADDYPSLPSDDAELGSKASDDAEQPTSLVTAAETCTSASTLSTRATKYRQWLHDRCEGNSRYNSEWGRPPCFLCFVPLPVKWLADYIEMNVLFERLGRVGCVDPEQPSIRKRLFTVALVCNFCSLLLTFFAALAATKENYDVLRWFSFTHGKFVVDDERGIQGPDTYIDIGLRAVAFRDSSFFSQPIILDFKQFCHEFVTQINDRSPHVFMTKEECVTCEEASWPINFSLAISLIFTFPSITTNFLRMWPNYDVNCQKFFGAIVGFVSLISSCYTWYAYTNACFNNFRHGPYVVYENLTLAEDPSATDDGLLYYGSRDWDAGWGLAAVVVATLLKGLDSAINWVVPTPSITRNREEQREYEELVLRRRQREVDRLSYSSVDALMEEMHQRHSQAEVRKFIELKRVG